LGNGLERLYIYDVEDVVEEHIMSPRNVVLHAVTERQQQLKTILGTIEPFVEKELAENSFTFLSCLYNGVC
jgi:hypothetical protein